MRKNVLIFGLASGLILATWMLVMVGLCYDGMNFENGMIYGYAAMILAFSFTFVGIKNFRDKYNNGVVSFGKAFRIGLYISLIASTFYVGAWLIDYYCFVPDFMDKYVAYMLDSAKAAGASAADIAKQTEEFAGYKEMYKNPLFVILLTYMEVLPIGLVIAVISALILKRKTAKTANV
ncbi:MAG: hypothetical protein FD123_3661 [Bacteroidetes bacterium]|nr:MAG: hypothetical protein FD123_3661 [Bacteroidota bacterium]